MQARTPVQPSSVVYRRIVLFFLLSYPLSWFGHLGNAIVESDAWPRPMLPWGPLFAAAIVLAMTEGRPGLRAWWNRIRRFRAPVGVYAAAVLVTLGIVVGAFLLTVLTGVEPDTSHWTVLPELLLVAPLIALIGGPATEEPSFRGYGQHELQQVVSPLATSLWIGLGVLGWHIPLFLGGNISWPIAIALPAVSVVYAWLYQAGGSVWPLVALHTVINVISGEYLGQMISARDDVLFTGFLAAGFVVWAVVLAVRLGPSLGHRAPGEPPRG